MANWALPGTGHRGHVHAFRRRQLWLVLVTPRSCSMMSEARAWITTLVLRWRGMSKCVRRVKLKALDVEIERTVSRRREALTALRVATVVAGDAHARLVRVKATCRHLRRFP